MKQAVPLRGSQCLRIIFYTEAEKLINHLEDVFNLIEYLRKGGERPFQTHDT
jgi:hypothetical protein